MATEDSVLYIGELASRAGVSIDTVRYYERRRILPCAARSSGGFRIFGPEAVERILFIKHAQEVLDEAREYFEEKFKDLRTMAESKGVSIRTEVLVGHPAEQIIHRAEGAAAGLIVLGRRGTSRFERILLGSTSERIINFAHCPVVVVK